MNFRLNFDDEINKDLIENIKLRAGGGSLNKALQTMVIEWHFMEKVIKQPLSGHFPATFRPDCDNSGDPDISIDEAVSDINKFW